MLGHNEAHWAEIYETASKLGLEVKIIPVFSSDLKRKGCIKYPVGPAEFLNLFRTADFVCTDSFHGMIFSIIFHVNFIEFRRFQNNDPRNQNFRIFNLANLLSLNERIYDGRDILDSNINFSAVDDKLSVLRTESINWLKDALDSVSERKKFTFANHVLQSHSLCCGCGACESVCPVKAVKVSMNDNGFYYAHVNENSCIDCGMCRKVCPIEGCEGVKCGDGRLFSYKDNDMEVLQESSSGGFAHRLASIANNNGYDVCGCTFNAKSHTAEHILIKSHNPQELHRLQGSKYMQSSFSGIMSRLGDSNKAIVFGTPCQISGVRKLTGDKFILVDLICHGVPSSLLYRKYLDYLKNNKKLDTEGLITLFRYKRAPGQWRERYIYTQDFHGRSCVQHQSRDPYFLMFEYGLCYSELCYECPYRDKSNADIRIGDYWGEKFMNDKTGVSMIEAMTSRGLEFMNECGLSQFGSLHEQPITDYTHCQQMKNLLKPVFYDELIESLKDSRISLPDILRSYDVDLRQKVKKVNHFISRVKKFINIFINILRRIFTQCLTCCKKL